MSDQPIQNSTAEFREVSPRTLAFIEASTRLEQSDDLDQDRRIQDQIVTEMLEKDASTELVEVVLHVEPEEVKLRRLAIERLRDIDLYKLGVITENDIATKLTELPTHIDFRPEVRGFTERYFERIATYLSMSNLAVEATRTSVDEPQISSEPTQNQDVEVTSSVDNKPNIDKQTIPVRLYKDYAIQIGDQPLISLIRDAKVKQFGSEWELKIAKARYDALKFIHSLDIETQERLTTNEIMQAILPNEPVNQTFIADVWQFLDELTDSSGEKLVEIWKTTPEARRRYYKPGNMNLTFEEVEEYSGYFRPSLFMLPNDQILTGRTAHAANAFMRASEEKPFRNQDIPTSNIYTEEEMAKLSKSSLLVSSLASSLRNELQELGLENDFIIHKVHDESGGPRSTSYWMEYTGQDQERYAHLRTENVSEQNTETESVHTENLLWPMEAVVALADWLHSQSDKLEKKNIPQCTVEFTDGDTEQMKLPEIDLYVMLGDLHRSTKDPEVFEKLIATLPEHDPRWPLINYMLDSADKDKKGGDITVVERILDAFPHLDYRIIESVLLPFNELKLNSSTFELQPKDVQRDLIEDITKSFYDVVRTANGVYGPLNTALDVLTYFSSRMNLLYRSSIEGPDFRTTTLHRLFDEVIAESFNFAVQKNESFMSRVVRRKFELVLSNKIKQAHSL
jgi:hypothetical protein